MWVDHIVHPVVHTGVLSTHPMPLYHLFLQLSFLPGELMAAIAFTMLCIQGYLLNKINARFHLIGEGTFLPGLMYLMFLSCFQEWLCMSPLIFVNVFVLLSFHQLFSTVRIEKFIDPFFVAGFFFSVASLFYFPSIFLSIVLFYYLFNTRSFYWREWFVALVGLLTPLLLAAGVYYLHDNTGFFFLSIYKQLVSEPPHVSFSSVDYVVYIFVSLVVIFAAGYLFKNSVKRIIIRQLHFAVIHMWLISSVLYVFIDAVGTEVFYFMAIPFSLIFAHFIIKSKTPWFSYLLLLFFVVLVTINRLS
jgi:hypothetical protein